jgi:hypothetical protein
MRYTAHHGNHGCELISNRFQLYICNIYRLEHICALVMYAFRGGFVMYCLGGGVIIPRANCVVCRTAMNDAITH